MKGQANPALRRHKPQRALRRRSTDAERLLWRHLRGRQLGGMRFRRQHPFLDYVLDFVCLEARLVVELDGGQHLDSTEDAARDARLRAAGFDVLRFWNHEVLGETEAVLTRLHLALAERSDR
ncbi:MAG: endonuclease domain-containing protein [Rhodocyclaceae bacterium]|nr:endonuclease domain-containing protein [Rhodocyclaceae bacterium]MCB1946453.1 endonuclease domain-containing protein [Thauera sp.]